MDNLTKASFLLFSKTHSFVRRVKETNILINSFLKECDNPCVSISFGKDSLCMIHLFGNNVEYIHSDRGEGGDTQEIKELKEELSKKYTIHTTHTDVSALYAYKNKLDIGKYLIKSLEEKQMELGVNGSAIGITRDESKVRRIIGGKYGQLFKMKNGIIRCYPIWKWTAKDVWAYIVSRDIKYPLIYDRMAAEGIPYTSPSSRTSNIVGFSSEGMGRFQFTAMFDNESMRFYMENDIL